MNKNQLKLCVIAAGMCALATGGLLFANYRETQEGSIQQAVSPAAAEFANYRETAEKTPAPQTEQGLQASALTVADTVVEVKEKMFIAQTNDIYLNYKDYLGKTLKVQGLFKCDNYDGVPRYFVIRYGPGCCGYDGSAGFEVHCDATAKLPSEDDWVEAIGRLETYTEKGNPYEYVRLNLASLNVIPKTGSEIVYQ
jgi:uncharacterized membrane protein YcgQ (UPF0703/DUF1980 family)